MRVDNVRVDCGHRAARRGPRAGRGRHPLDGAAPLSEAVLLAWLSPGRRRPLDHRSPHFLAYAGRYLAGYAHLGRGPREAAPPRRSWWTRHSGDMASGRAGPCPRGCARDCCGARGRDLSALVARPSRRRPRLRRPATATRACVTGAMRRSLGSDADPLPGVNLPEGFGTRHFVIGQDEDHWLRVNARAFVDHPEQGRLTRQDLDRRIAEPWFDARGFILIEDMRGFAPVLAASHWTKVVPADRCSQPARLAPERAQKLARSRARSMWSASTRHTRDWGWAGR